MQIILVISAPQEQNTNRARDMKFEDVVENKAISRIKP